MATDYAALNTELTGDPESMGYTPGGADPAGDAVIINDVDGGRTRKALFDTNLLLEEVDFDEYVLLTPQKKEHLSYVMTATRGMDISAGKFTREVLLDSFPDGTTSYANLIVYLVDEPISRAVELGHGVLTVGDIEFAYTQ
jgi:hypothetical protein